MYDALARYSRLDRTKLISIDLTISRYAGSQIKFQLIEPHAGQHHSDNFFATQFFMLLMLERIRLSAIENSAHL